MQCSCCFHRFALVDADGVGDPVIGKELELNAIIAVVIGGTSLFGEEAPLLVYLAESSF